MVAKRAQARSRSRSGCRSQNGNGGVGGASAVAGAGVRKPANTNKCEHLMKKRLAIAGLTIRKMKMEMKTGTRRNLWEKKERTLQLQNLELEKEIKKKTLEILNRNLERHSNQAANNNNSNNNNNNTKSSRSSRVQDRRESTCRS